MSNKKFVYIGEMHDGYMLCQVGPGVGMWICPKSGNRLVDDRIKLEWKPKTLVDGNGFGTWVEVKETPKPKTEVKKDDVVYLTRYIRCRNDSGEIDNMSGVTLVIKLDYKEKEVLFSYSICDGDNFDKGEGTRQAFDRLHKEGCLSIPMNNGEIPECGVVDYICEKLYNAIYVTRDIEPKVAKNVHKIVQLWLKSA